MTDRDATLHRAAAALARAIAPGPDDDEHPGYELLEALVDGRLDAADREAVQAHVDLCGVCAEDAADLSAMRGVMQPAAAPAPGRRRLMVIAASIAATMVMVVWFTQRGEVDQPVAQAPPMAVPPLPAAAPATALTPDERAFVDAVKDSGRVGVSAEIAGLTGPVGTLLGNGRDGAPLVPITPIGTAVLAARPPFSWTPMPGARAYTVQVFDERFTQVASSGKLTATSWTPGQDLPEGRTLAWQVTAHLATGDVNGPAPPQPEARFRVIDSTTAATIVDQRSRLSQEPLALGILLARAGLYEEATRLLERAAADPATRTHAQAVMADLRRTRR